MSNYVNATADVTPEGMEAEVEELIALNVNMEWRWGDAGNSTVTLPEAGQHSRCCDSFLRSYYYLSPPLVFVPYKQSSIMASGQQQELMEDTGQM